MKHLFTALFLLGFIGSYAQNLNPNRYYGDLGLHFGSAMLNSKYSSTPYRNYGFINGIYLSFTAASDKWLAKTRGAFFAGDRGNAYLHEVSLMAGTTYRKRFFAFEAVVGPGYYYILEENRPSLAYSVHTIGLSFEGSFQFTPARCFAISPFIFGGLTTKSTNSAFGVKIGFGKYN